MIAVIPAAGKATRFCGIYKELLPVETKDEYVLTGLEHAVKCASQYGAREAVIVTTRDKIGIHAEALKNNILPVSFILQKGDELWGAISSTFYRKEDSILIMPDTLFQVVEAIPRNVDFALGLFTTGQPQRYSIVKDKVIYTKPATWRGIAKAWGTVYWSLETIAFWRNTHYDHYDEAFNAALQNLESSTFVIHDYIDLGSMQHYKEYIRGNNKWITTT